MSQKLRKTIIIRAFNRRKPNVKTFYDQFQEISYKGSDNREYIDWTDLQKYLDFNDSSSLYELSQQNHMIDINDFLYFLTYGRLRKENQNQSFPIENIPNSTNKENNNSKNEFPDNQVAPKNEFSKDHRKEEDDDDSLTIIINEALGTNIELHKCGNENIVVNNNEPNLALVKYGSSDDEEKKTKITNIWRKSEVMKQERIVSYVTIDALGTCQVLFDVLEMIISEYTSTIKVTIAIIIIIIIINNSNYNHNTNNN
jgi:hypothetical protein